MVFDFLLARRVIFLSREIFFFGWGGTERMGVGGDFLIVIIVD